MMRLNYSLTTLRQCAAIYAHFCSGDCSSNNTEEWRSFYREKKSKFDQTQIPSLRYFDIRHMSVCWIPKVRYV